MPLTHDDYAYAFIWDGTHSGNLEPMQIGSPELETRQRVESFSNIFQSMWSHYLTWGGRIFAHTLVQFFIWIGKPAFDIANTIIFALLVLTIIKLSSAQFKLSRNVLLWIFFTLFILSAWSVNTLFWLTGACNYLWMAFFHLLFLVPYVRALHLKRRTENSIPKSALMILLGLLAGCSNEAGALATVALAIFLVIMAKRQQLLQNWMLAGLSALIIGCIIMIFAPGNFVRLEVAHPNFTYTAERFWDYLSVNFPRILFADLITLFPTFMYFLRRDTFRKLNTTEILMLAFMTAGFFVPLIMLFSPEFNLRALFPSTIFVLVAATIAILQLEQQPFKIKLGLPKKFLRGVSISLTAAFAFYFASLIYVDVSIFNAAQEQIEYIRLNSKASEIRLKPMPICYSFEKIHGDKSAVPYLKFFAGIREDKNYFMNIMVAQYYGVKSIVAVDD